MTATKPNPSRNTHEGSRSTQLWRAVAESIVEPAIRKTFERRANRPRRY
jgi:hypothetical protein